MARELEIDAVVSMPFQENSYVVRVVGESPCFVIDPGFEPDAIVRVIEEKSLTLEAIVLTHGHVDHIAGNAALKERYPDAPIVIGAAEARMITDPLLNLSALGGVEVISPPADVLVRHGQKLELLGLQWEVRDLPGHSPGHVVYLWHGGDPVVCFDGDTLFAGSIGRYDFPGSDGERLLRGLREELLTLPDHTRLYPGHGPPTTVAAERATNPFLRGQ